MNAETPAQSRPPRPLCILIAALGGEGGGVLADYLVDAASAQGFPVQSTSIPGVSQRTGATTYYVEIYPRSRDELGGREPVLSLIPGPGNVDVLMASELVEAGRAMRAGFVSPQRTTLVASTHRIYAIEEKIRPGDGRFRDEEVRQAARQLARRALLLDLSELAARSGAVINTVLFGAAAASGALGLSREACEDAIRRAGKSVEASLRGFAAGWAAAAAGDAATGSAPEAAPGAPGKAAPPEAPALAPALARRCEAEFPEEMQPVLRLALARLVDYLDEPYAASYLDRLRALVETGGEGCALALRAAPGLAVWMAYEDIQRVAALKSRASRIERVRGEVGARPGEPVRIFDYFRPGIAELADVLPPRLFARIEAYAGARKPGGGWCIQASSASGQILLRALAWAGRWRRSSARFASENALIERWLAALRRHAGSDRELALELAGCARLVKGYSDTRTRAHGHLAQVLEIAEAPSPGAGAGERVRALRETWLAQADGEPGGGGTSASGRGPASTKVQTVVFIPKPKPAAGGKAASG